MDFQISPPLGFACFYVTLSGNIERFQYFNFGKNFLKNANSFQKADIESTKIENATYLYQTALSEANVKINRMGSTKWTYYKERSFASN